MIAAIKGVLENSLTKVIDTHNTASVIFIFSLPSGKYLLKAEYGTNNATSKEVNWYKKLPEEVTFVPKCRSTFQAEHCTFLILTYITESHTIDDLALQGKIDSPQAVHYVNTALKYNKQLFERSDPRSASKSEVDAFFTKKYEARMREAHHFPYLRNLLQTEAIVVNDKTLHCPNYYLKRITANQKLSAYLTPRLVGFIHGDLHCGNILVDQNEALYFVDPNGAPLMPLEYDYGKLLHSIHGGYSTIVGQQYLFDTLSKNEYYLDLKIPLAYKDSVPQVSSQLDDRQLHSSLYAECLHFATMLPHHAQQKTETTVLFLRCIQLFDELFQRLDIGK